MPLYMLKLPVHQLSIVPSMTLAMCTTPVARGWPIRHHSCALIRGSSFAKLWILQLIPIPGFLNTI